MIFIDNKYTRWYYAIVDNAKTRSITGYTETHHIIPRSIGGSNQKDNLVKLTAREHFVCHMLLVKMLPSSQNQKLVYAAWCMIKLENKHQTRYKVTSRVFQWLKEDAAKLHAERTRSNNPMSNPAIRKRHQESIKKRGKTLGTTGKKLGPKSAETRAVLSQKTKESMTPERRERIRQQQLNRTLDHKEKHKFAHSRRISCIYCRCLCKPGSFNRWHGANCKLHIGQ